MKCTGFLHFKHSNRRNRNADVGARRSHRDRHPGYDLRRFRARASGGRAMFFNLLFAGIIAFNFYEPLAAWVSEQSSSMAGWADMLCLMGIFSLTLIILGGITDMVAPAMTRLPTPIYHLGRLLFGFAGACVAMAVILCGFATAPVSRKMFGSIDYKAAAPLQAGA